MKNIAFTICTKSYIGLATVLKNSLLKYSNSFEFYIFIADEINIDQKIPENTYIIKDLNLFSEKEWTNLSYKYNVTEFCTCLKPYICKWLLEQNDVDKIFYMDPDLFFFSNPQPLIDELDNYLIELTPHFLTFPQTELSKHYEDEVRFSGIFNLGFLGLVQDSKVLKMLSWWCDNLSTKCFGDSATFQFTDQKWMDFMPLFFNSTEIKIIRNLGWNLAPWNYFERKVFFENNLLYITERENVSNKKDQLVFCHFSGFNYRQLLEHKIIQNNEGHENNFDDIHILLNLYIDSLLSYKDLLLEYFDLSYSYDFYSTGERIDSFHRRLYRTLQEDPTLSLGNPFDEFSLFYKKLKKNGMIDSKVSTDVRTLKSDEKLLLKRVAKISKLFRIIYKFFGYNKFQIFLRFLRRFSRFENQIYLLDKNYVSWK